MSPCLQGALEKMSSVAEEINKAFTEKVSESKVYNVCMGNMRVTMNGSKNTSYHFQV